MHDPSKKMRAAYFETLFRRETSWGDWPQEFAIITAYATTGETWTDARNRQADQQLEAELRERSVWVRRLTGYSPSTGHAEPGWAVKMEFTEARSLGRKYLQDAVYFVSGDTLAVSFSDVRATPVVVGPFRARVRLAAI